MKNRFQSLLLAGLCAASGGCGRKDATAFRTEAVTRGPVGEVVSATGEVSAIITVNVGSQVSGTISQLLVDFNSKVKKGQLLATIDPRLFQAQFAKAQAGLASANANVEKADVGLGDAARIEKRQKELRDQGLISQSDLDTATAGRLGAAASLSSAKASVLQARADRDLAAANLAYARITSPIDGVVVSRNIDIGQTVAAAFQAPTLFMIANDLTKMRILANIDEADVGKIHDGLEARFTVDAWPGEQFRGQIQEVRQAPTTIQNVVTYAAVIDAPNPEHKLRQGMTASVTVTTARHEDVLRLPNAALRWKPDDAVAPEPGPGAPRVASAGGGGAPQGRGGAGRGAREADGPGRDAEVAPRTREGEAAKSPGRPGRVYKLVNGKPEAVQVRVGLSDGRNSEVLEGLADNDTIVVGGAEGPSPGAGGGQQRRRGPF